jgi:hypothetical protein
VNSKFAIMKPIIQPVDKRLIKKELTKERFLRPSNKADNEIYVITAHNSPNTMREIGRLRELSFRSGGGGTGNEIDTDRFDFLEKPYKQLILWNPKAEEIVGGYRFLEGWNVEFHEDGQPDFVMSHLFHFSDKFIKEYLPYSIELGRAFVQPDYQTSKMGLKSMFALDNLWDGLGALIHSSENARYFIGKVTMYNNYSTVARELIYEYMFRYFPDPDNLIFPKKTVQVSEEGKQLAAKLFEDNDPAHDFKSLQKAIRNEGHSIPPLFNAYIGLTETMRMFGSMIDPDFGSVYETGILVTMADLLEVKRLRYIEPYIQYLKGVIIEKEMQIKRKRAKRKEEKKSEKDTRI